ncbi:aldehyde dehydrogenase family protein [Spiroplasma endosymbiont of Aspidapion aeneum]|uniref:aldehyde dehydrogenase family protein n=1 Tax=Spiroplasma endosymbiont of Aspidapion aeneum TaxID=3066276 RepID=UPI00313CDF4D
MANKWKFLSYINGKIYDNKKYLEIINPSTLEVCGEVSALTGDDIDLAFNNARKAQKKWEAVPLIKRIEILKNYRNNIAKNCKKIATIMVDEIAKSMKDCEIEVERTIDLIDYVFEEAKRIEPIAFTGEGMGFENKIGIFSRVAKGVILAISPYNYPINLSLAKIIPALVTGNVVVFKPATQGSLVGAYLGQLALESNLPESILQVVTGKGRDIGDILTTHKEINMISFTGSVNVGHKIKKLGVVSDLVLELGGKDPGIVLDDNKIDLYASEIVKGAFGYSGQRCTAIKRVITTNIIADKLVPKIKNLVEKLTVGMPLDNADITPLIDMSSKDFVQSLIDDSLEKKAKLICGNKSERNLLWPTVIDNVSLDCRIAWEEQFGPVLPIIRAENIDEIVKIANNSTFGLQASVFCSDIDLAISTSKKIEAGSININSRPQRGPDSFPFLGIKDSGEGVQGIRESLLSMTRYRGIIINHK